MQETRYASISLINDRGVDKIKVSMINGDHAFGFVRPLKPKPKIRI